MNPMDEVQVYLADVWAKATQLRMSMKEYSYKPVEFDRADNLFEDLQTLIDITYKYHALEQAKKDQPK